jgi:hypothetical protein
LLQVSWFQTEMRLAVLQRGDGEWPYMDPAPLAGRGFAQSRAVSTRNTRPFARRSASGTVSVDPRLGVHMARSTRNDTRSQSAAPLERDLHQRNEIAASSDSPIGESESALELLGASGAQSGSGRDGFAARGRAALGARRPPQQGTSRHRSRPSERAEARFTSDDLEFEFLTD